MLISLGTIVKYVPIGGGQLQGRILFMFNASEFCLLFMKGTVNIPFLNKPGSDIPG